ncbi:PREDICTED: uncharacterized protein LOC109582005 [Amphimedon queenslandica]|uniref:Uncharacterized protein n=1 Tax=Amphimedon queenslandica TaxID=400682 RepID=A0AAN0J508_AMPQE|nr:PREDICTED: uncharacterized protein LOC109582005 [Amphimedon queenslandica]|eukprot:XP_019852104.1 PREDICTED: uncharacterized protein LOC109582005 [Amphimedon queenslandica]
MSYNNTEGEEDYDPLLVEHKSDAVPSPPQPLPQAQPMSQFIDIEQYKVPPVPPHLIRPPPHNHVVTVRQPMPNYLAQTSQSSSSDYYLNFAVILTVLCFFCGTFLVLLCTIPAMVFASQAKDEELRGDMEAAQRSRCLSLAFSGGAIVFGCGVVIFVLLYTVHVITF